VAGNIKMEEEVAAAAGFPLLPLTTTAKATTHHAEGLVNPKVREPANGYYFWIPQSM
jgi:hypothetical protein